MPDRDFLDSIFMPGNGILRRTTNRLRRGYLKKSLFNRRDDHRSIFTPHQGKKEIERRRRRMERMNHD